MLWHDLLDDIDLHDMIPVYYSFSLKNGKLEAVWQNVSMLQALCDSSPGTRSPPGLCHNCAPTYSADIRQMLLIYLDIHVTIRFHHSEIADSFLPHMHGTFHWLHLPRLRKKVITAATCMMLAIT
jgi:hypothetical protein